MGSRYYESCSSGEEIKPGKISAELRAALNIAENDIPLWVYRMRALGYPPGWLKKAIVDTNDIFDTDSKTLDDSSTSNQSRKRKSPSNDEIQYDHSKLIEYPGFNSPMPKGCVDYHYYINMPAMLEHQQLEYAKKHMNAFEPVKLPKRSRLSPENNESSDEANNNTTAENPASPDEEDNSEEDSKGKNKSTMSLPDEIKLLSKGSPMPKPVKRASLEKFSEGVVGELLYFENLPASTGKFDSIRGLLNTMKRSKTETSFTSTKSDN